MPLMLTIERPSKGSRQKPSPSLSGRRRLALFLEHRERVVDEDERARLVQVVGRAEADDAALVLRQAIHPAARGAVEGHLVAVAGEEVLAEVFAELLEEIAEAADDRVVAQHAVLLLRDVADEEENERADEKKRDQRSQPVGQDVFQHCPLPSSLPALGQ